MPRVPELEQFKWPDVMGIQQNALTLQKTRNELEAYPEERAWTQQEREGKLTLQQAQIKKVLAEIDEIARKAKAGEDVEAPFMWDGEQYLVSGKAERVRAVTAAGMKWPDQVDKNFLSWAATTHEVKIKPGRAERAEKVPTENPNVWQATINSPTATPEQKAVAAKNLADQEERQKRIMASGGFVRGLAYSMGRLTEFFDPETGETRRGYAMDVLGTPGGVDIPGFKPGGSAPGKTPKSVLSPSTPVAAAGKSALSQLEAQEAKVLAFAETAERNLDIALGLSDKVDRTGIPVINRWLLAGKKSIAGDKDVAAFDAALRVGINEFARVTTTATGGGVTSDQARHEVEEMLKSALTPEQIKSVVTNVLKPDMQNRRIGYQIEREKIQSRLRGGGTETKVPAPEQQTAAPTGKTVIRYDAQGNRIK